MILCYIRRKGGIKMTINMNFLGLIKSVPLRIAVGALVILILFLIFKHNVNVTRDQVWNEANAWLEEANAVGDIYVEYFQYNEGENIEGEKVLRVIEGVEKIKEMELRQVPYTEFTAGSIKNDFEVDSNKTYNVKYTMTENPEFIVKINIEEN